jgi:hypothetical protein
MKFLPETPFGIFMGFNRLFGEGGNRDAYIMHPV